MFCIGHVYVSVLAPIEQIIVTNPRRIKPNIIKLEFAASRIKKIQEEKRAKTVWLGISILVICPIGLAFCFSELAL